MSYRDKLADLGIEVHKVRNERQGYTVCPKCSHTRKKKKDPCLSVKIDIGAYNCHHCGWNGNVRFDNSAGDKKTYVIPTLSNQTECSDDVVKWFLARCVSQSTLLKNGVKSGWTWMPQTQKEEYCIQFNYIRNGQVVNVKHRDSAKNFRLEKDAELIFYGLDDLKPDHKYILIAEGEIDKLSWNQAGIDYALSVPNGATKSSSATLEYLDNCIEYFDNDKKIILATDNDEPGMILREELSRRLGKNRCYKVDFKDVKDANDYAVKYGDEALSKLVLPENLIEYPIKGVLEIDDIWELTDRVIEDGLKRGVTTGLFPSLDELMSFNGSKLCVVTGAPNMGKSPFVDMIAIALAIRHGWKWAIASMESKPIEEYVATLFEKIIGRKKGSKEEKERVRSLMRKHFFFIEANNMAEEVETMDFILESVDGLVKKKGINGVIIDPWNKIEHFMKRGENETNYVSRTLDRIIRVNQKYNLFTFLIAHPVKMETNNKGHIRVPTLYDISGSSNFYNKADWGLVVHINSDSKLTEVHVAKAKARHLGKRGRFTLRYNGGNGRLTEVDNKPDFTNWLDSIPFIEEAPETIETYNVEDTNFVNDDGLPEDPPF